MLTFSNKKAHVSSSLCLAGKLHFYSLCIYKTVSFQPMLWSILNHFSVYNFKQFYLQLVNRFLYSWYVENSPLLTALVIISVILILVISAVVWFLQQRNNPGSSILNLIEYHPPFGSPSADQTCLVEAEEIEEVP